MKEFIAIVFLSTAYVAGLGYFGFWGNVLETAEDVHSYDKKSHVMNQKLIALEIENNNLKAKIDKLVAKNQYLALKSGGASSSKRTYRSIASVENKGEDYVQYDVYQWKAEKLLAIAEKELFFKNYEKAAQFYNTFLNKHPSHELISDEVLFKAGYASYEAKKYYGEAKKHFTRLIASHPRSSLYRSAKLWLGLSYFNTGDKKKFMATVEEFKSKYRNTTEWKILSKHYEEIAYQYGDKR
jgi:tetratricopeptide (TPR) repeat protein